MDDWLFVLRERNGKRGWWLKLSSEDEICRFFEKNPYFHNDYAHYCKIKDWSHNDRTVVTHTQLGAYALNCCDSYGMDTEQAYDYLSVLQISMMKRMLADTGCAYVNRNMGVNGNMSGFKTIGFVRKKELVFPSYYDTDIRIKRFPDGEHYYAYIGDAQVRDGDIVKWDTYDEAYEQALRYSSSRRL